MFAWVEEKAAVTHSLLGTHTHTHTPFFSPIQLVYAKLREKTTLLQGVTKLHSKEEYIQA